MKIMNIPNAKDRPSGKGLRGLLLDEVRGAINVLSKVLKVKREILLFKSDREGCKYKFF